MSMLRTPYADLLPPLSTAEREALAADIAAHGVRVPIEVDEDGNILDGHNRYAIDPDAPTVVVRGLSAAEKQAHVFRSNDARRNMSPEQKAAARDKKKQVAADLRTEDAKRNTNARIAMLLGASESTVSRWMDEAFPDHISNLQAQDAYAPPPKPDARVSVPRQARREIVERTERGEPQAQVAADLGISQPRVSQIITQEKSREQKAAQVEAITQQAVAGTFERLYDVVVIDPPWPMARIEREVVPEGVGFDYPTMTEEQLAEFALPLKADAHLWLWTTHRFLPMALRLLEQWGLKYVCTFVWHKPGGFQPFGLPQYNCEFALYARRGSPTFTTTKAFPVCFSAPRGEHSEKPEEFYQLVRDHTGGARIDIFNRRVIDGFDRWGNEVAA